MNIKLKHILLEDSIADLIKKIDIKVKIDKTQHASIRQHRHSDYFISDSDIIDIVKQSLEKIAYSLLFNRIDIGDYVLLKRTSDNLNLVCNIKKELDKITILVITVIKKKNFIPKKGTVTIFI